MKRVQVGMRTAAIVAALVSILAFAAQAQTTIVPTAGQTPEQMGADRTACDTQAAAQSGYHPSQPAPATRGPTAGWFRGTAGAGCAG